MAQKKKSVDNKPAMKPRNPRAIARRHPAPGQSPLWDHWPRIRDMRRARKTWAEIASAIEQASGKKLKVAPSTVCNFYRRIENRKRRGKRPFPIGYEEPAPGPSTPVAALSEPTPEDSVAAAEAARARIKARSQQPEKPKWDLGYDPDKPLKP